MPCVQMAVIINQQNPTSQGGYCVNHWHTTFYTKHAYSQNEKQRYKKNMYKKIKG